MPSVPNPVAVAKIKAQAPIASPLNTAGWSNAPIALRDSAFFSAKVERFRLLQRMQDRLTTAVSALRREEGAYQTKEKFVAEMQKIAREEGLDPRNFGEVGKLGGLQDVTSLRRLNLIYDTKTEQAQEFAKWKMDQDPDVLNAFPAQEFIRVSKRKHPRSDWLRRWKAAGGKLYRGRMIALKTDPVWQKLSRFGTPWPPFDFGSGMGLRDISRRDAIKLGVMKEGERIEPIEQDFNQELQASVKDLNPKMQSALKRAFGDQVEIKDGVAKWIRKAAPPRPLPPPIVPRPAPAPAEPAAPAAPSTAIGTAVSKAARIEVATRKQALAMKQTMDVIDKVHGDGPLTPIPINNRIMRGSDGTYYSKTEEGAAVSIGVRKGSDGAELSFVHEVGHWLDHIGIKSASKFASRSAPELEGFRQAIQNSAAYKEIVTSTRWGRKFRDYLLEPHELFARAYSQFITEESGSAALRSILDRRANTHWTTQDFAPIRAELRKLFVSLGWMK
jgi:hypothetical protein